MEQGSVNLFDPQIDQQTHAYLYETARWGKFLAIIGFIFCGLFAAIAIFAGSYITSSMQSFGSSALSGSMVTVIYILIALLWFFPCLHLFHFANKMKLALTGNDQEMLNTSFKNLKGCFKFMGIITIIVLSFYAIALLAVIAAMAMGLLGK